MNGTIGFSERKTVEAQMMLGKVFSFGVIVLHRGDIVSPRDGDAVFGPLELGLQRQEILVRFEVRIVFADREQTPERARERVLRVLQLLDFLRVGQVVGVDVKSMSPWRAPR